MSSPSTTTAAAESYGAFPPGTIVLAKLKSFPPWPAIIIPDDLVPQKILKSKPKRPSSSSAGNRRSKRKTTAAATAAGEEFKVWCVRFLKDDTYMWASVKELELLTEEKIQKTLENWKSGKTKQLKSAYEMALNPPDVEDFIIYGSDGKPIQIDNEADDEDFQIEEGEDEEEEEEEEEIEEISEEPEDLDNDEEQEQAAETQPTKKRGKVATSKGPAKKRKTTTTPPARKSSTTQKKGGRKSKAAQTAVEDPDTSGDEDWENDIDEFEEAEIIETEVPTSSEYIDLLKKQKPLLNKIVIQFTTAFLEEEHLEISTEIIKLLNSLLDQLSKVQDIVPKSLLIKNNVHKLFIGILQRNDLKTKNVLLIRTRLEKFLKYWFDISVQVNPNWKLEPEEEEEVEEEEEEEDEEVMEIKQDIIQKPEAEDTQQNENVKEEEEKEEEEEVEKEVNNEVKEEK